MNFLVLFSLYRQEVGENWVVTVMSISDLVRLLSLMGV